MLQGRDLHLTYGESVALAGAGVTVHPGEAVALTGASGSGKTSILYCLAGLIRPTSGHVILDKKNIVEMSDAERTDLRRRSFGFVFQFAELVPELTLRENVSLPLELNGIRGGKRRARVAELLERLGIGDQADRRPAQVSGGQMQRAAVARALVHRPAVLFADEPTGSLDSDTGKVVLAELMAMSREEGSAVLLVTHDATVAAAADRIVEVSDGRTGSAH